MVRLFAYVVALATIHSLHATAETLSDKVDFYSHNRLRLESVDQENLGETAKAFTLRSRYGAKVNVSKNFSALVEGETVVDLAGSYNNLRNGKALYPVVADAAETELNRVQLSFNTGDGTKFTLGRQRIILGNARFVGNVGFRQNEQTFDAIRLDFHKLKNVKATYAYMNQVNRIFGDGDPVRGRLHGDVHAYDIRWNPTDKVSLAAYGLVLELDEAAALSTSTMGARIDASLTKNFGGVFEFAHQKDKANNPFDIDLNYWTAEARYRTDKVTLRGVIETLEGDGTRGFSTPLATLHKFQGFADVFLATPANGIQDFYINASVKLGNLGALKGINAAAWFHDFKTERGNSDLGNEFDLQISAKIHQIGLAIKFASYNGTSSIPGRDKFWLTATYNF